MKQRALDEMSMSNQSHKRPFLRVSKIDAAKRQIETAVRLWFFSGDLFPSIR
jgi:hypothetical protein